MHLRSILRMVWRNLGRNRARTSLALLAIGIAQTALLASAGFANGYSDAIVDAITGPMIGHVQVHSPRWRDERGMDQVLEGATAISESLLRRDDVQSVSPRLYAPAIIALEERGRTSMVLGVRPQSEALPGGLLAGATTLPSERAVLVGEALARRAGLKPGDEIALVGQTRDGALASDLVKVTGILATSVELINRSGVVMDLGAAQSLFGMDTSDAVHELVVRGTNPNQATALADSLRQTPELAALDVSAWQTAAPELKTMVDTMGSFSAVVLLLVTLAAAAGVANTTLMATYERMREFGLLMAMGTSPRLLVRLIVSEATLLGLLGVAAGTVVGGTMVYAMGRSGLELGTAGAASIGGLNLQLAIKSHLLPKDVLMGVLTVLVTSMLCALWPAVGAARLEPNQAIRS